MSTLLLTTPSNPGAAAWDSSTNVVGPVLTNITGASEPLALPTLLPSAGVTIPANTLVDGAVIDITCALFFDTAAAGGPVDVCLGANINGQNTNDGTGIARYIQLPAGPLYGGGITISAIFTTNGNQLPFQGTSFLDELGAASTVNGQTRLIGGVVGVDPTLPCTIYPVVLPVAPDPGVTVSASQLVVSVRLP
jgi:hypothetical protein